MTNKTLSADELQNAHALLAQIRKQIDLLAGGDPLLRFAYRRKIVKELGYEERSKPVARAKLKSVKWDLQKGICAHCNETLPMRYSELDRKNAIDGYTVENTELVHAKCHQARQAAKRYT
jgi:UTP:GlnB (protein PII) uridylyltransferase